MGRTPLVLFGVGNMLKSYEDKLKQWDVTWDYYTDNDNSKWGERIKGKEVIPPERLVEFENEILICCSYEDEIKEQLIDIGLRNRIVTLNILFKRYIEENMHKFSYLKESKYKKKDNFSIVIDSTKEDGCGGTNTWSYTVARGFLEYGYTVSIYGTSQQIKQKINLEKYIIRYNLKELYLTESVKNILLDLNKKRPFVLISNYNHPQEVLAAAYILKSYFPEEVKLISVVHTSNPVVYERFLYWCQIYDAVAVVSQKIKDHFRKYEKVIYYKESPIIYHDSFVKLYSKSKSSIRLGIASRIQTENKMLHLIPEFLKELENKGVEYILEIAGSGSYFDELKRYIDNNELNNKVILLGRLPHEKMEEFWKRQDVFLSFSKIEGMSLSMLEAMSYGIVPVVTDVSGVDEFIKSGENGYICKVGNVKGMAEGVYDFFMNREKLQIFGEISKKIVKRKCNISDFVEYYRQVIKEICNGE